ncbi:MAG: hypothetical protein M3540_01615 [Actinomycetota bacterium]|nr:hypothetical protein [Actinomycetota bacterium]
MRSRFWRTRLGKWLRGRIADGWIGRKFHGATAEELHGYAFWGPVALAIALTEILGTSWFDRWYKIPWPTISTTIGHIEDIDNRWAAAVVAVIALAAFYALTYDATAHPTDRLEAVVLPGPWRIRYGWPFVVGATIAIALFVSRTWPDERRPRFNLAYAIYGSFAVLGIAIPLVLAWKVKRHAVFPNLFFTFAHLRERIPAAAMLVAVGLSVLVIHLALYPWPNLAREPATYGGLTALKARAKAVAAIRRLPNAKSDLQISAQGRGFANGRNVWLVYFVGPVESGSTYTGCFVEVNKSNVAKATAECSE